MGWLSGYQYRKKVTISGSSGAGENYQVKLTIGSSSGGDFHLEGHCVDFPNDIRFTDDDGETLLDYWIEDPTQDPITVWVEVKDSLDNNVDIYCYTPDHEILTEKGWVNIREYVERRLSYRVATLNPETNEVEYHKPEKLFKLRYKGKIIKQEGRVEFEVIPNHRLWIKLDGKIKESSKKWQFREARNLPRYAKFRLDFPFEGKEEKYFLLPGYTKKWNVRESKPRTYYRHLKLGRTRSHTCCKVVKPKKIPMDSWLRFLGIYLAEGSLRNKGNNKGSSVVISHKRDKRIDAIISDLGFKPYYIQSKNRTSGEYLIHNRQLVNYLKQFGHAEDKFIPRELLNLSRRQLKILFDSLMMSDGSYHKNGTSAYYATISKRLANDFQELALKVGWIARIVKKDKSLFKHTKHDMYFVNLSSTKEINPNSETDKRSEREYNGYVYSVQVPNHIIYVRRNGKPHWNGNCYYGNPSASSASNGNNVFEFFDDFSYIDKIINETYLTNWTKSPNNPLQNKTSQNWLTALYNDYDGKIWIFEQRNEGSNSISAWSFNLADADNPSNWTDHGVVFTPSQSWASSLAEPHGVIFETQSMADAREGVGLGEGTRKWRLYYCGTPGSWDDNAKIGFAVADESDLTSWTEYSGNPVYEDGVSGVADPKVCIYENKVWLMVKAYGTSHDPKAWFTVSEDGISNWTDKSGELEFHLYGNPVAFDTGITVFEHKNADHYSFETVDDNGEVVAKYSGNPVLTLGGSGEFDESALYWVTIVIDKNGSPNIANGGTYYMYYIGKDSSGNHRLGLATSTTLTEEQEEKRLLNPSKWTKNAVNTITHEIGENYFRFKSATDGTWPNSNSKSGAQHQAKWELTDSFILEWRSKISDTAANQMGIGGMGLVGSDNLISAQIAHVDPDGSAIYPRVAYMFVEGEYGTYFNVSNGDERDFKIVRNGNTVKIYEKQYTATNYNLSVEGTSSDIAKIALIAGKYSGYPYLNYVQVETVIVRKYADPEPTFSSAQAEEGPVFTCGDTLANLSGNWWAIYGSSSDVFSGSSLSLPRVEFGPMCSDILNALDSPNSVLSMISRSQDLLGLTDLSASLVVLLLNAIDSIDVSDGCTLSFSFTSSCLDVLHAIDSASYPLANVVNCLDSLGAQDSISPFLSMLCQSKDNIGGADGETSQLSVERALLDILAFQDTSSYLAGIIASASDILNTQDLNSVRLTFSCSSIDIVKNVDGGGVNVTFHLSGDDILKGADFVSGNLQILLDSLAVFKSADQSASSLLGFILRSASDVLDMYDLNTTTLQISSSSIDIFRTEDTSSINITLHLNSADVFKNSDSAILNLQALLSALETLKASDSSTASVFAEILASASDLLATSDYNTVRLEFLGSVIDIVESVDNASSNVTLHLNSSDLLGGMDRVTAKLEALLSAISKFKSSDESRTYEVIYGVPVKIFKAQHKVLVFRAE